GQALALRFPFRSLGRGLVRTLGNCFCFFVSLFGDFAGLLFHCVSLFAEQRILRLGCGKQRTQCHAEREAQARRQQRLLVSHPAKVASRFFDSVGTALRQSCGFLPDGRSRRSHRVGRRGNGLLGLRVGGRRAGR